MQRAQLKQYKLGDDHDLEAAIHYNNVAVSIGQIKHILAYVEGAHDEEDYYWLLKLHDGSFGLLYGGCDFTGWDCQSDAHWVSAKTALQAIGLLDLEDSFESRPVHDMLKDQLSTGGRKKSWYEDNPLGPHPAS